MSKRLTRPAPPPAPDCPQCATPGRCGALALHYKGPQCLGRTAGPDRCDCLNYCGDDPWLKDYRAQPCSKFMQREKPQPIYFAVYATTNVIVGPFTPLPWDYQ